MNKSKLVIILFFVVITITFLSHKQVFSSASSLIDKKEKLSPLSNKKELRDGDIIFQSSQSQQCTAIRSATKSKYTHCGIIYIEKGQTYVYEAIGPVKKTPFNEWILQGKKKHYVVKRLKDADKLLTTNNLAKMKKEGETFYGKKYDLTFEWSDNKIYCSELIWKIYKRALNIEVGKLQKIRDLDLTSKFVKKIMNERYGNNIPMDETVISPASIFDSKLLETIGDK